MNTGFLACIKTITHPLALPIGRHAQVVLAAIDDSQDAAWDRPYFDLIRNRDRLVSPHLRGASRGFGKRDV